MKQMINNELDILNGSIPKSLLYLGLPIVFCSFTQQIYSMLNLYITSHTLGSDALAIMGGSCDMLITLFTSIVSGMTSSAVVLCGQLYGAKKYNDLKTCIENCCHCSIAISIVAMFCFISFADNLLCFTNSPSELIPYSSNYLRLYSLGFIPYFLFQLLISCLRGIGQTRKPTYLIISSFIINGCLDILFLGIFKWNVYTIALSYFITNAFCCYLAFISFRSYYKTKPIKKSCNLQWIKKILLIGIPCSLTSVTFALTNIYLQSYINLLGKTFISSYSINVKVENIYWFTLNALALACTTFISQNFGAKKFIRISKGFWWSLFFAFIFTLIISISLYVFSPYISMLLSNEQPIINTTIFIMKYMSRFYITYFLIDIIVATLKAIGFVKECTLVVVIFTCSSRIIRLISLSEINPSSVLSVFPISWSLTSLALILLFLHLRKKLIIE